MEPTEEKAADRTLRRAILLVNIAAATIDVVWLIDTKAGTRDSVLVNCARQRLVTVRRWWGRRTAGARARAAAPEVWWEAWMAAQGQQP